jgi:hypothetical protein
MIDRAMSINITSLSLIHSLVLFCERLLFVKGYFEMERLVKAVALAVILFFVVLGFVIGSRMDQTTIALLGGTTIGLLIAAPCSAIVTYLVLRNRDERGYGQSRHYNQPQQTPPQYWVVQQAPNMPQSQPHYNTLPTTQYAAPFELPPRRKFYLIGESGDTSEIQPDADTGD